MMNLTANDTCSRCGGAGETWESEDGHPRGGVYDRCYHCGGSGKVHPEVDFHDRLGAAIETLAIQAEREYRRACNEDPEGEGYDFAAAENGVQPHDYFQANVWARADRYGRDLAGRPHEELVLLILWVEQEQTRRNDANNN